MGWVVAAGLCWLVFLTLKLTAVHRAIHRIEPKFDLAYHVFDSSGGSGLAMSRDCERLALVTGGLLTPKARLLLPQQVIAAEAATDSTAHQRVSTGSVAGRAAVGVLLLGPVGAILGGMTGKRSTETTISYIELLMRLSDPTSPLHRVRLFTFPKPISVATPEARKALHSAKEWEARLNAWRTL